MSGTMTKRRVWRPVTAGVPVTGGAGGFHLPQREGRSNYISAKLAKKPKPKRRRRRG